jgi:CRP-like cAMP-binding protein
VISSALIEKFGRCYNAGDVIFCEFEEGNECFIIHTGEVVIVKISEGVEKVLANLKAGDIFGEMGVLEKKPRTATAIAQTDLTVLAMDLAGLKSLVTAQPFFAFQLGRILGQRIVQSYRHLTNLSIENPRLRVIDVILWRMEEPPGQTPVTNMSPQEIADFAGLPRSEVDKVMKEFAALGRLKPYADRVEVNDVRSLRRLLKPGS